MGFVFPQPPAGGQVIPLGGYCMRGRIKHRQVCPVCGRRGSAVEKDHGGGRRLLYCACGRWQPDRVFIYLKWQGTPYRLAHDMAGRRFAHYIEADRALGLIRQQIEDGAFYPELWVGAHSNRLLWQNYLADWYDRRRDRWQPTTARSQASVIKHLAWFDGRNIRDIRTAHVEDFRRWLDRESGLALGTRRTVMATLRAILADAKRRDDIERAPRVDKPGQPRKAVRWLLPADQARVLAHLPRQSWPIYQFLFRYGCRVSEACGLCWDCIDFAQGLVWIKRTLNSQDGMRDTTKTHRDRPLPLFDDVRALLEGMPRGLGATLVFRNPTGRRADRAWLPGQLNRLFQAACRAADLEPMPLKNATRHSAGMKMINLDGLSAEVVSRLLGHASTATTLENYAYPEVAILRESDCGYLVAPDFGDENEAK